MKYLIPALFLLSVIFFAPSCQKCYQCTQYCSYCQDSTGTGVRYKICATKSADKYSVDSILTAYRIRGYTCTLLNADKNVCDQPSKLNDALNYYYLEDYYCNPK